MLIGTQMVAKGLDLPAVTLVGVISADIGLHIPDFRSAERTFQLLTQVAGRAGRAAASDGGPPPGRVVIQTYTPDNYAIVAAAQHDYASSSRREIELRREEAYPPFVRLARLVYSHSNPETAERQAERMARQLRARRRRQRGLPGVEVLGPAPPHVPKWHGRYPLAGHGALAGPGRAAARPDSCPKAGRWTSTRRRWRDEVSNKPTRIPSRSKVREVEQRHHHCSPIDFSPQFLAGRPTFQSGDEKHDALASSFTPRGLPPLSSVQNYVSLGFLYSLLFSPLSARLRGSPRWLPKKIGNLLALNPRIYTSTMPEPEAHYLLFHPNEACSVLHVAVPTASRRSRNRRRRSRGVG